MKIYPTIISAIFALFYLDIELNAQNTIGVEAGWAAWKAATGNYAGGIVTINTTTFTPITPRFSINSGSGIDACTPGLASGSPSIPLVAPGFGNASIQLGQTQTNGNTGTCAGGCVEKLKYHFCITPADTNFVYTYAIVLENPPSGVHTEAQAPFAEIYILDPRGDTVECSHNKFMGDVTGTTPQGMYTASCAGSTGNDVIYKPWTTVGINLAKYVGRCFDLVIINADCSAGDHFFHSYWDFNRANIMQPKYCAGQPVTLCAPFSDPSISSAYQWYKNHNIYPGGTTQCLVTNALPTDTFFVNVERLSNYCRYSIIYVPKDTCLVGVKNYDKLQSIIISPNPSNGKFGVQSQDVKITGLEIYNVFGERFYSNQSIREQLNEIDISSMPEGVYFVKIQTAENVLSKKIVLVR